MADSTRLQILKALTTLLETANGLRSGSVYRGRLKFGTNHSLPRVAILEAPKPGGISYPEGDGCQSEKWQLYIQGFVKDDGEHPTDAAHELLASVKQKLVEIRVEDSPNYSLGGLVHDLEIDGGICRPPDDHVQEEAYFLLNIIISMVEDLENPDG